MFLPARTRRVLRAARAVTAAVLFCALPALALAGPGLAVVSATAPGAAVGFREGVDMTPDGRYVVFCGGPSSPATTGPAAAGAVDVYVKDLASGALSLVSVSASGATGSNATNCGPPPTISNDGRYVAFVMDATNLVTGVTYAVTGNRLQVFLRDRQAGTTTLLTRSPDGLSAPGLAFSGALVSGNGRFVVFAYAGLANTLIPAAVDANGAFVDLYAFDRQAGTLALVNATPDGLTTSNGFSVGFAARRASISDDGRVLFSVTGNNILPGATLFENAYVRDLVTKVTRLASSKDGPDAYPAAGVTTGGGDWLHSISADGRYVGFLHNGQDLVPGAVSGTSFVNAYVRDLIGNTTRLISVNGSGTNGGNQTTTGVLISRDGSTVVLNSQAQDLDPAVTFPPGIRNHVFVRARAPLTPNSVQLLSVTSAGGAASPSDAFINGVSSDGRYVAFRASGTDLVAGVADTNGGHDIFVRDRTSNTTTLYSTIPDGTATGNAPSGIAGPFSNPVMVADDGRPVFPSTATNLVTGSTLTQLYGFPLVVPTSTITGTVTRGGVALPNVTMTLSGGSAATTTTSAQGTYAFTALAQGTTYTVTPSLTGATFTPPAITLGNLHANQIANFAASCVVTLSGLVRDGLDGAVSDVTITLTPGGATATTDVNGRYTFSGLTQGVTYAVTPSRPGFTFAPATTQATTASCDTTTVSTIFVVTTGLFTRYFAEGATGTFFDTAIALLNASGTTTNARVTFQTATGQNITQDVSLSGIGRATLYPETLAGLSSAEFSTVIVSDQPVIADRTMRWDASGYGSHAETSIAAPLTTWYLAEGATLGGFNLFYLVQNPNPSPVTVTVTYLLPSGAPIVKAYPVQAASRLNIWVNQEDPALASTAMSAILTATAPIIVERAMYRDQAGRLFGAGHESSGLPGPALTWFFAEGATGPYFDLFYLAANPGLTTATLEGRFLLPNGSTLTKTYAIPPQSRFNIWADRETFPGLPGLPLGNTAVSATFTVTNDVPVVMERTMWWPGDATQWFEGHNSAGALLTGTKWGLADGEVGGPSSLETYILVANVSAFPGQVQVTLVYEDGTTSVHGLTVAANSRTNFDVRAEVPGASGRRFGAIVESIGATPAQIVVERAMYNDAGGVVWAAGTNNLGTRLR
jgi:hypothetical protein